MKIIIFIALILLSLKIFGQTPMWIKILESSDPESVTSSAPYTETELISLFIPSKTDNLVGTQIEITTSFNILLDFHDLSALMEVLFVNPIYRDQSNRLLNLNQGSPQILPEPNHLKYVIGHTSSNNFVEIPLIHVIKWQDPETKIKKGGTINILVKHFYSDPFLSPEIKIESADEIPLRKGVVHFARLGPGDHRKYETSFYIENGKVINPIALSAGHYEVELTQPEECSGILNENLVILPDDMGNNDKFKFVKSCGKTYDIFATYNAPGFANAQVVWRNTKIRFPHEGEEIQYFDSKAFMNSGADMDTHPNGTDGKPLDIPYAMNVPGIGKQTLYGWPENENATPYVISVASLGGNKVFDAFNIKLTEDALNACNISQIGDGPVYLELGFDLTGKYVKSNTWQQVAVRCVEDKEYLITKGASINGYPLTFKQIQFEQEEIEKFQEYEEFEKTISNGTSTLKIEFKLSEKANH